MKPWVQKVIGAILIIVLAGSPLADSARPVSVQAGITVFADPSGGEVAYVEFPFVVNRHEFEFLWNPDRQRYQAAIFAELTLSDTLGAHLDSTSTIFYTQVKDTLEARQTGIKLPDKLSLMIKTGIYRASLTVIDVTSKRSGTFNYDRLEIDPIVTDRLSLSNVELAYNIRLVDDSVPQSRARLIKNGREVLSSPMGIFSERDSMVFIYAELYNLDYDPARRDSFQLNYQVYDTDGNLYRDLGYTLGAKPGSTAVISNVIDITGWAPGRYDLRLTATDRTTATTSRVGRRFVIYPEKGDVPGIVTYAYTSPLDTASLETRSNLVKFIMDPQDMTVFNSLTDTGKSLFIGRFFKDRDPTPETDRNEYLEDALNRYIYANERFGSPWGKGSGWRTDMGRVLLQYGTYDDIKEGITPSGSQPWQVWLYHKLQGGVYFVFVDQEGYGHYELVHSTLPGEVYSQYWDDIVKGLAVDMKTFE